MEALRRVADGPFGAILIAGTLTLAASATVGLSLGIHTPSVHDEQSYLLAADTFAHGRLANPPHPGWRHFETFHVIQQPSYASKYPPAQGLALALGQVAFGHPIAGVWLSVALMSAALCWMLQTWFSTRWALLGSLLFAARFGVAGQWSQDYWGGAIAATGGALLLGGAARSARDARPRDAIALATGAALLANSRPYEGLAACLPAAVVLAVFLFGRGPVVRPARWRRVALPAALIGVLALAWSGYYNWRVTGDPMLLPYAVHRAAYETTPLFLFGEPPPRRRFRHEEIRRFHEQTVHDLYEARRNDWIGSATDRIAAFWSTYLGAAWTLAILLAFSRIWREPWLRLSVATIATVLGAHLLTTDAWPHYLAPAAGAVLALVVGGLHAISKARIAERPLGAILVAVLVLWSAAGLVPRLSEHAQSDAAWYKRRASLIVGLAGRPEGSVVFVRYLEDHNLHQEWVYNGAELDTARVVFARTLGPDEDRRLMTWFPEHRPLLLEVGSRSVRLQSYPQLEDEPVR